MFIDPAQSLWWHLERSLAEALQFNSSAQIAPAALLWTDPDEQWKPLLPILRARIPHFVTLGTFDAEQRQGPAIYLKCLVGRTLAGANWPASAIPIVYLPKWGVADLRAVESCPDDLAPVVELGYRGTTWKQRGGRDWSPVAWLCSKLDGLNLDVGEDRATAGALRGALPEIIDRPLKDFQGKRIDAPAIHHLIVPDLVRDLLHWLDGHGKAQEGERDETRWSAFCAQLRRDYGVDPEKDGALVAAERLVQRAGSWAQVWDRFAEHPQRYPRIPDLLAKVSVNFSLFDDQQTSPAFNEKQEEALRAALLKLGQCNRNDAAKAIAALETEHSPRRGWVWATLDRAPLAQALRHLAELAQGCQLDLGGTSAADYAGVYAAGAWRLDAAAWRAITSVSAKEDRDAIVAALRGVYAPWLDAGASSLQSLLTSHGAPAKCQAALPPPAPGEVWVFADGLRYDIGEALAQELRDRGLKPDVGYRWAALPTVTATAKPAISPVADLVSGKPPGQGFAPLVAATDKELTTDRFRALLADRHVQVLGNGEIGDPAGSAWTEVGDVDSLGHTHQASLARFLPEQVSLLADRIEELLAGGWRRVRVVTDHGWLWLPSNLPKRTLPKHCTVPESRWARCAVLEPSATTDVPVVSWHWHDDVRIALAPGAGSFFDGTAYAHGGISAQECLAPVITLEQAAPASQAKIGEVRWARLKCKITITGAAGGELVDLRQKANDPKSSMAINSREAVGADGTATLFAQDDHEGKPALLVLLDSNGVVLDKRTLEIGAAS